MVRSRSSSDTDGSPGLVRQIFGSIVVVAICWIFLRFGGLIVSVAISHTWHSDNPIVSAYALLFRQLIMMFIYPSVLAVFRPAFIPLYNEIKREEGEDAALRFAGGVLEIGMLLGLGVFGFIFFLPEFTVSMLAPGFSPEEHAASVRMMRQMAPGVLCLLFAEMYLILFHAEKRFAYPHGAEAVHKIGWGLGIVVASHVFGWQGAAIGITYSAACLLPVGFSDTRDWWSGGAGGANGSSFWHCPWWWASFRVACGTGSPCACRARWTVSGSWAWSGPGS